MSPLNAEVWVSRVLLELEEFQSDDLLSMDRRVVSCVQRLRTSARKKHRRDNSRNNSFLSYLLIANCILQSP
jgi:hypothetical protein